MAEEIDVTKLKFSSSVFPTEEDMKLWDSLTPYQQHEFMMWDLVQAQNSGIVDPAEVETFFERVKRIKKSGLNG